MHQIADDPSPGTWACVPQALNLRRTPQGRQPDAVFGCCRLLPHAKTVGISRDIASSCETDIHDLACFANEESENHPWTRLS